MVTITARSARTTRAELRALHPELPFAALAAAGWGATVYGHEGLHSSLPAALGAWTAMATAMMVPTALPAARRVARDGLSHRRLRGPALYLAAYLLVWIVFGAGAIAAIRLVGNDAVLLPVLLAGAAAWELSPAKREYLRACQSVRAIAPRGWKADRGCLAAGVSSGGRCVNGCGLLMTSTVVGPHALWPMLAVGAVIYAEKLRTDGSRLLRPAAVVLAVAAIATSGW